MRRIAIGVCLALMMSVAAPAQTAPELIFDQAKRAFDALNFDQALPLLDKLVLLLVGSTPPRIDLLTQAYQMRGRARFSQGDPQGAEQDFAALLNLEPSHKLPTGISPRIVTLFENVRKITIGRLLLSVTPSGEILIDGKKYTVGPDVMTIELPAGEHQISSPRAGYRDITQKFTITAAQDTPLAVTLERLSATLTVITVPSGVEVLFDGTSKGVTQRGEGTTEMSAPMVLSDLQPGNHRLTLKRDCHRDLERTVNIDKPDDFRLEPLRLTASMATVKVQASDSDATVLLDGTPKGGAPIDLTVCEGSHVIEVRGAKGRFIDRREWKTGDAVTLAADLRSPYAIVAANGSSRAIMDRLRLSVERTLAPARKVILYVPSDTDLDAAIATDEKPTDWLLTDVSAPAGTPPRFPRDAKRDLGRKLTTRLGVHGLAVAAADANNPNLVSVWLLAAGSGEPDKLVVDMADSASRARAVEFLSGSLPALVRPSMETSFVDLPGVQGAVVIRAGGVGAKAGLALGDVIVNAGGTPIVSVAELRAKIAGVRAPAADLPLEVKGANGQTRKVAGSVAMVPDTIPIRDPSLSYNRALFELRDLVDAAPTPIAAGAARLNLAIAHIRLGNWDEALTALQATKLPEGPGVSAGTIAYLTGLVLTELGRTADAQAAFTRAAAAPESRLSFEGPLVAPLAQQKLRR